MSIDAFQYRALRAIAAGRDTYHGGTPHARDAESLCQSGHLTLIRAERHPTGRRTYALTEKGREVLEAGPDA